MMKWMKLLTKQSMDASSCSRPNLQHQRRQEISKRTASNPSPAPSPEPDPPQTPKKNQGLMWPTGPALDHPAAPLLENYSKNGCPVDCGLDSTVDQILAALAYGAHPSAKIPGALKSCLIAEAETKVENCFATIVTWEDIKNDLPKKLKILPVAMIPHKSRAFQGILDLSFHIHALLEKNKSVNETTNKLAQQEAMNELGSALMAKKTTKMSLFKIGHQGKNLAHGG